MATKVLITGASSGLGAALARYYAAAHRPLALGGRNSARLAAVADACRAAGAPVTTARIDVTDRAGMASWLADEAAAAPLGLVIANAGISRGPGNASPGDPAAQHSEAVFAVNLHGVIHTLEPALGAQSHQGFGQIAVIGSMAGLRGLPSAPAYSASKTAARCYAEALQAPAQRVGVDIRTVLPGFIHTPLTAGNRYPMPGAMSAEQAAARVAHGLRGKSYRIVFPGWLYAALCLVSALPERALVPLLGRLPNKA